MFLVLLVLFVYGFISDFVTVPPEQLKAVLIVTTAKWMPVFMLLPLLIKGSANNYVWLAYLLIPYFCWSVIKGFAPALAGLMGAGEAVLIALVFTLAVSCARWRKQLEIAAVEEKL